MMAASGLFVAPVFADNHGDHAKAATEASAEGKVAAFVVSASGGGWGAAEKVSSALNSQEGVKAVILSGLRATVIMNGDAALNEAKVKASLKGKGMTFVSMEKAEMTRPKVAYELAVSGATWAIKNEKARVALEKLDGVTGAFVNNNIALHFAEEKELDEKLVASTIKEFGMKVKTSKKIDKLPF